MLSANEEFRYRSEVHSYTKWQRIRIWWNGVVEAIKTAPDNTYSEFIRVYPGEVGYDNASFSSVVVPNLLRYRLENGEWVQVDENEELTEVNPDWHDE